MEQQQQQCMEIKTTSMMEKTQKNTNDVFTKMLS